MSRQAGFQAEMLVKYLSDFVVLVVADKFYKLGYIVVILRIKVTIETINFTDFLIVSVCELCYHVCMVTQIKVRKRRKISRNHRFFNWHF